MWGPELRDILSASAKQSHNSLAPRTEVESIYEFSRVAAPQLVRRNYMGYGRKAARQRGRIVELGIGANHKFASSVIFGPGDNAGKIMGLAPYAKAREDLPK